MPVVTVSSVFIPINNLFALLTFDFYNQWHTIALLCFVYPIIFVAKTLTTLEEKKAATFGNHVITTLTILVFPIGVFLVQPRIKWMINFTTEKAGAY